MKKLAREIISLIVFDQGPEEFLRKLSDPFWFQALGCVLGFDWHSSGLTTTVCGAIKEGLKGLEKELGLFVAGGKGGVSRHTPQEIEQSSNSLLIDPSILQEASRMAAKVDNNALQDGYQLYHHSFFYTREGKWAVVQQGMNEANRYARRYHWLGEEVSDFVNEPEAAICCDLKAAMVLNLVSSGSAHARDTATLVSHGKPEILVKEIKKMQALELPGRHNILLQDLHPERLYKIFCSTYERQPENFVQLLGMAGVGPKAIRALSLIAELVYGVKPDYTDPARFSFAHGGKDRHPYPVDRKNYDHSIDFLRKTVSQAKLGQSEKVEALRRLATLR
jgi:hypothetical protein